ncbi:MAG TPA: hypothetical protein VEL07_12430 [Planctomycetota bacterium]|nr:hypothetical protein [Planctomycetota bacterium]
MRRPYDSRRKGTIMHRIACSLLATFSCAAFAADPAPVVAAPAGGGLELPESVIQDPDSGLIWCANVGGKADAPDAFAAKDGNGFISRLNPDGTVAELRALPKPGGEPLNGPKGMAVLGGALWVADIDRVVCYELESGTQLQSFDLTEQKVAFANDLVFVDDMLLLSDTIGDQLIVLHGAERGQITEAEVLGAKGLFGGANGLAAIGATAYLASFPLTNMEKGEDFVRKFTLGEDMSENTRTPLPGGLWDGLALGADGTLYATDWRSKGVWAVAPGAKEAKQISKDMNGPADLCVLNDGALLVPEMLANKVTRIEPAAAK